MTRAQHPCDKAGTIPGQFPTLRAAVICCGCEFTKQFDSGETKAQMLNRSRSRLGDVCECVICSSPGEDGAGVSSISQSLSPSSLFHSPLGTRTFWEASQVCIALLSQPTRTLWNWKRALVQAVALKGILSFAFSFFIPQALV